jgi:hypothetical protein
MRGKHGGLADGTCKGRGPRLGVAAACLHLEVERGPVIVEGRTGHCVNHAADFNWEIEVMHGIAGADP